MLSVESLSRLHVSASFELRNGECIALQGASGAGKSLLMRAIADLDPNEGVLKLDGALRESMPAPVWRKKVTYVATEPGWWAETVQEHFSAWDDAIPFAAGLILSGSMALGMVTTIAAFAVAAVLFRDRFFHLLALTAGARERVGRALELIGATAIFGFGLRLFFGR